MKKITILFTLFWSVLLFAQNDNFKKPNYSEIKKKIVQKSSKFYYQKLLEKYNQADTTLTLEEKRVLYYGFINNSKYSPYSSRKFTDKISTILKKNNLTSEDYDNVISYSNSLLDENPFSINAHNYKLYAYKQLDNAEAAIKASIQLQIITDAILSSGDGLTKETAYVVIIPSHEHSVLNSLGYKFGGKKPMGQYDYLSLKENQQNIEGLYFDASASANYMSNLFKK